MNLPIYGIAKQKGIPYWFVGAVACFVIFVASTLYFGIAVENTLKTNPDGNAGFGYGLMGYGIDVIVVPFVFLTFVVASFFQRKRVLQYQNRYIAITIVLIIIGMGFTQLLPYFFPATYESNIEACDELKSSVLASRCYARNAIRKNDPSLCNKMYVNEPSMQWHRESCRENVKRGHW